MNIAGWTTLTIASLLAGSGLATAQTERVITARELQQFNPHTIEAITRETVSDRPASASARRAAALAINPGTISSAAAARVDPGVASPPGDLRITPEEYVILTSAEPAKAVDCRSGGIGNCIETPLRYLAMTPSGESLDLALVLASPENLRFNAQSESFVGDIFVQLRDLKAPDAVKEIGTKIGIVISADVDEITPASLLEIGETNRFRDATRLTVKSPIEPTVVKLTPERGAQPQQLSLGITRPRLKLQIGQDTILGYGLETATVTVQTEGAASLPTQAISISSRTGHLDQNAIHFDAATGIASTFVRSRGLGGDTITASLAPFSSATDTVAYEKPWTWLIAVLIGVAVGVGIRLAMRAKEPPPKSGVAYNIAIGVLGGVVTAVLYALGVNILALPLPGGFSEGLTFVLSALGGWVFPTWLSALGAANPSQAS